MRVIQITVTLEISGRKPKACYLSDAPATGYTSRDRPDDDVTKRCQDDGEPDGHSVHDHAETCVEEQKTDRRQSIPLHGELGALPPLTVTLTLTLEKNCIISNLQIIIESRT